MLLHHRLSVQRGSDRCAPGILTNIEPGTTCTHIDLSVLFINNGISFIESNNNNNNNNNNNSNNNDNVDINLIYMASFPIRYRGACQCKLLES